MDTVIVIRPVSPSSETTCHFVDGTRNAKFRQARDVPPIVGEKEVIVNNFDTVPRRIVQRGRQPGLEVVAPITRDQEP